MINIELGDMPSLPPTATVKPAEPAAMPKPLVSTPQPSSWAGMKTEPGILRLGKRDTPTLPVKQSDSAPAVSPVSSEVPSRQPADWSGVARFKGEKTQQVYLGLYQDSKRPSVRLKLPQPLTAPTPVTLALHGSIQPKESPQPFVLSLICQNTDGKTLQTLDNLKVGDFAEEPLEWLTYLQGFTGLSPAQTVPVTLPLGTQTVLFQVKGAGSPKLVGYLGTVTFGQNGLALQGP